MHAAAVGSVTIRSVDVAATRQVTPSFGLISIASLNQSPIAIPCERVPVCLYVLMHVHHCIMHYGIHFACTLLSNTTHFIFYPTCRCCSLLFCSPPTQSLTHSLTHSLHQWHQFLTSQSITTLSNRAIVSCILHYGSWFPFQFSLYFSLDIALLDPLFLSPSFPRNHSKILFFFPFPSTLSSFS